MCVTSSPAVITDTRAYVLVTTIDGRRVHVSGYQNTVVGFPGIANCMFLHYAGSDLGLVQGPQHTTGLMADITRGLEPLVEVEVSKSAIFGGTRGEVTVEPYGDFDTVRSDGPGDILGALGQVQPDRRPELTSELEALVSFYVALFPDHSFILACCRGSAAPKHPIVVSYVPNDPTVLTIPGLEGHDGGVPTLGAPVERSFAVAFGIKGVQLPQQVRHSDPLAAVRPWAPTSVAGFLDNRVRSLNGDYVLSLDAVTSGRTGSKLAAALI